MRVLAKQSVSRDITENGSNPEQYHLYFVSIRGFLIYLVGLSHYELRQLNDEINQLFREKGRWEYRIKELGGKNYMVREHIIRLAHVQLISILLFINSSKHLDWWIMKEERYPAQEATSTLDVQEIFPV
jgi:Isy1-like splicing family